MRTAIKFTGLVAIFFLVASPLCSQEALKPLNANINYRYAELGPKIDKQDVAITAAEKSASVSLFLPFIEDFSYAYKSNYPTQALWQDSSVYVNTGFAIAPPSIGVATFDGLSKRGYPYTPNIVNLPIPMRADTLTSRPINLGVTVNSQTLQPSDKVALSFYYQAGGHGDYPENSDSLILDFYNPTLKKWSLRQWFKLGANTANLNDTLFKRAFLWIKDNALLKDSFQFRFRNYAATNGDFDHWNLDYIYLDLNRDSIADTSYKDIAFASMPTPFLKNYSSMPFQQFIKNEMATRSSVRIRSNYANSVNITYNYEQEYDKSNNSIYYDVADKDNLGPFNSSGYCNYPNISSPVIDSAFKNLSHNTDFKIKHCLSRTDGASQFIGANDTIVQSQLLCNYYAFDDGSAEAGYYVLGAGGKMAVRFTLNKPDSLLGVKIYFEHVANITQSQTFTLTVWDAGSNGPGSVRFTDTSRALYIKTGFKEIPEYIFKSSKSQRALGPGTYYIGFKQGLQTGISVGFDKNLDHRNALYYDSGSGWTQSQFYGSVMIRPLLGSLDGKPLGMNEIPAVSKATFKAYPNPSSGMLHVYSEHYQEMTLQLVNAMGQVVRDEKMTAALHEVNLTNLENGIYFLFLRQGNNTLQPQKIILSH